MFFNPLNEWVSQKSRIVIIVHHEPATSYIYFSHWYIKVLNIETDIIVLIFKVKRLQHLSLTSISVLEPGDELIFGPLGRFCVYIFLGLTLWVVRSNLEIVDPSDCQIVDRVNIICAVNECFRLNSIIHEFIIVIIEYWHPWYVSYLCPHWGVVKLYLESWQVVVMLVFMPFEYSASNIILFDSIFKYKSSSDIFHSRI